MPTSPPTIAEIIAAQAIIDAAVEHIEGLMRASPLNGGTVYVSADDAEVFVTLNANRRVFVGHNKKRNLTSCYTRYDLPRIQEIIDDAGASLARKRR